MLSVLVVPSALANDTKLLPGAACLAQNGAQQGDMQYTSYGRIQNTNASEREVIRPIVRDNSSSSDLVDVDMNIYVPAGVTVTCTIISRTATGGSVSSSGNDVTGGGSQTLDIGQPATSWTDGYYYVECTLPSIAAIYSYRVEEL